MVRHRKAEPEVEHIYPASLDDQAEPFDTIHTMSDQQPQLRLVWTQEQIRALEVSSNQRQLVISAQDGLIHFDVPSRTHTLIQKPAYPIDHLSLTALGHIYLSILDDQVLWARGCAGELQWNSLGMAALPGNTSLVPDGSAAMLDQGEYVEHIDLGNRQRRRLAIDTGIPDDALAFAPDGRTLAAVAQRSVQLWDLARGRMIGRLAVDPSEVYALAIAPDGLRLAVACTTTIQIWDLASLACIRRIKTSLGQIGRLRWSPDGRLLGAVAANTVHVYACTTGKLQLAIDLASSAVDLGFLAHSGELVCASTDTVGLYYLPE